MLPGVYLNANFGFFNFFHLLKVNFKLMLFNTAKKIV